MPDVLQLAPADVIVERPFTHPDHVAPDFAVVNTLLSAVRAQLPQIPPPPRFQPPWIVYFPTEDMWQRRVFIMQPDALRGSGPLLAVGFFGQRRIPPDALLSAQIFEASKRLMDALTELPGLVSYCTVQLADAYNYANLVLMSSEQAVTLWRQNALHQYVNTFLSPGYYANVRIYHGQMLPDGAADFRFQPHCVKYWDYQTAPVWRAVRMLTAV